MNGHDDGEAPRRGPPARRASLAMRTLIVEDNDGDADLLGEYFAAMPTMPVSLSHAPTIAGALGVLRSHPIDAVILDLGLPDSNGVDSLTQIKAAADQAPVIVVSGTIDDRLRERLLAVGADEVFAKDEPRSRLFARAIHHAVQRRENRDRHVALQRILAAIPDAVVVTNPTGRIRYANDAAIALLARPGVPVLGEVLAIDLTNGAAAEVTLATARGRRLCSVRVAEIEWTSEPALLASLRDITDQRHLETQLNAAERLASIGMLAASVAHEVNNPLASVIGNLQVAVAALARAGDATTTGPVLDALRDALTGAHRIQRVARDLKVFARPEDDEVRATDVDAVVDTTVRLARHDLERRARVVVRLGAPPPALANDARLGQVVLNLLMNAGQAIAEGAPDANHITIATSSDHLGRTCIAITDTGCGIPVDVQARIFTPFFTTKPVGIGTGLGMAISHKLITSVGGQLTFVTEVGRGTTFTIALPAATTAAPAATTPAPALPITTPRGRVLIVDDEPLVALVLSRALADAHQVTRCASAPEALARFAAGDDYDVVLCDVMMPKMSGIDLYRRLAAEHPGHEQRIVFMTGGAYTAEARAFLESVPNRLIGKPFDIEEIRALVRTLVAARPIAPP